MYSSNTAELDLSVSDVAEPWSDCHTYTKEGYSKDCEESEWGYEKEAVAKADGGCRCLVVNYKRRSAIQVEDELL